MKKIILIVALLSSGFFIEKAFDEKQEQKRIENTSEQVEIDIVK